MAQRSTTMGRVGPTLSQPWHDTAQFTFLFSCLFSLFIWCSCILQKKCLFLMH